MLPADLAYAALGDALAGDHVRAVPKELELYAADEPPPGYSLDVEIDGIIRTADAAGFDRFHLVGYSGGGASAIAFTARQPERVRSLALLEPAWIGNDELSPEEQKLRQSFDGLATLPPGQMMAEFQRLQLAPGVEPPSAPPGPPPPWMAKRPGGIHALTQAFDRHELELDRLRAFDGPVYYALGTLSNPDYYGKMAERAERLFADFRLERFEGRHHFDPPHRIEPDRLAGSLRSLWAAGAAGAGERPASKPERGLGGGGRRSGAPQRGSSTTTGIRRPPLRPW